MKRNNMKTKRCVPRDRQSRIIYRTKNPNYCYKTLPIENFPWKNKSKGLRRHACSSCRYKSEVRRYNKNPEAKQRLRAQQATLNKKSRDRLRAMVNEIKSNSGCVDCKGTFPPAAMEFDHVRGTKKYNVSEMVGSRMSDDAILKEIEKCEVRCANCHRIKTHEEPEQSSAINNPVLIKT